MVYTYYKGALLLELQAKCNKKIILWGDEYLHNPILIVAYICILNSLHETAPR